LLSRKFLSIENAISRSTLCKVNNSLRYQEDRKKSIILRRISEFVISLLAKLIGTLPRIAPTIHRIMFIPAKPSLLITIIDRISRDCWVQEFRYDRKYDRIL